MALRYVLIGFMGSGKTSIGMKMSYRIRAPFLDTDSIIEKKAGRSISDIFASDGEEAFRDMETECLRDIVDKEKGRFVLATGGGMPLREENRELLHRTGIVVYLKCRPETVYKRLTGDGTRPLLKDDMSLEKISSMMEERDGVYSECADVIVDCDEKGINEILNEITSRKREEKAPKGHRLLVINGPNLNFLGIREKAVYGTQDYSFLLGMIAGKGKETGSRIEVFQSNHEGAIIDRIQDAFSDGTEGIIINPGAFTHYSYAIRDALASVENIPRIEVHISDIQAREEFRKVSVTGEVCNGSVVGHGLDGYLEAVDEILKMIDRKQTVI